MISRDDLTKIAKQKGFPLHVIEKDYALTWALKAIYSNPKLFACLAFKGGTCLSKIYAEKYRLSEDLDFTAFGKQRLSNGELRQELEKAFNSANQRGAPNLEIIVKDIHENPGLIQMPVKYVGPLNYPGRLKVEVSLQEKMLFACEQLDSREKTYADIEIFKANCYALDEILLEKLRAIMQRGKTRDYYDLWQLVTRKELLAGKLDAGYLEKRRADLVEKCGANGIEYRPQTMFGEENLSDAQKEWQNSLGRVVKNLPDFKTVIDGLKKIFRQEADLA
ncbi:nucleotidyl transferase AbiEii/AbiGii toxin family protein [Candidatus Micrarchaeota archaeon]|nr:nucleotidyl transferase AbiEii/AbiGii toxin family protein [Candidatus Micrarchaeota archaeon]